VSSTSGLVIAALIASVAFAGLAVAAILTLLQLRRTAQTAAETLAAVEREIRPLAADVHALLQEHRDLARQAGRNLREVEGITDTAKEVVARLVRLTNILGSLGTVGKALSLAQGVRRGAEVFLAQLGRRRA
jgi:uncharacterized protein YoxC